MKTTSSQHICTRRVKGLFALAVMALFLTSCATQGDQARTEGTLAGAGIGAAVGAGLGFLIGGGRGAAIGAGVGAAIGGTSGYVYANNIAKRHEELRGKEDSVNARIVFAQGVNADTQQYNNRLRSEVAQLEPKIADLEARARSRQITSQDLATQKQALNKRVDEANQQLILAQNELRDLKNFRAQRPNTSRELDEQIRTLEANLADMQSTTSALAALPERI